MKPRLALALAGVLALAVSAPSFGAEEHADGVFIHISHGKDDPHRLLMALSMAVMMSEDHDVLVYFDITGIDAVLKDSVDVSYSHFPTSKTQLAEIQRRGVTVMACPGCLKAAGRTKDDLADGVQIANKAAFFSFTKGRILTLDY
ncbi:MAG: DsrE family protein [Acidobacteria bacterium]|jgi:predicted peroxiredoxin|nr:DsrE family protein [Acidobacteriota bacterium]